MVDFGKALINSSSINAREAEVNRLIRVYSLGRDGHSHFSPSSSAGWLNCMGFVLANAGVGDVAGDDAAYGTVAHVVAAEWLTTLRDNDQKAAEAMVDAVRDTVITENGFPITVDANMLYHIRRYIDWCREVEIEGDVFIEQRVDYSVYTPIPNQGGTADHFVCVFPGVLIITDLKMGIGIWVDVVRNTQAMLYALGVFLEWDWMYNFQTIKIRICQPRLDYFGVWECTREDLLAFGEEVREKSARGWVVDAPRSPSPKACQWCADKQCPAKSALLEDLADDYFDDDDVIEGRATKEFTAEDLDTHALAPLFGDLKTDKEPRFSKRTSIALMAWRYSHRSMYETYFREIGAELLRLALAGEHIPGWKIGDGRRSFAWYDPEDAAQELSIAGLGEAEIFKVEVTSVSQARKLLRGTKLLPNAEIEKLFYGEPAKKAGRKTIAAKPGLVNVIAGRPTLVRDNDPREDVQDAMDDAFDDDDEL